MTTNEMITELRDMASQILSPHSEGQKMFMDIADRLATLERNNFLALEFGFRQCEQGKNFEATRIEYCKILNGK